MKKEKIEPPNMRYKLRQKPCKSFSNIPMPKWRESWKCQCGGINAELFCNNCGKTRYAAKHHRKLTNRREFKEQAIELCGRIKIARMKAATKNFAETYIIL